MTPPDPIPEAEDPPATGAGFFKGMMLILVIEAVAALVWWLL